MLKTLLKMSGFSLIELMIAIAIFGLIATMGFSSYQVWIQNTRIRSAVESIQSGLQLARSEAVKRNIPVQFNFRTRTSWTVCTMPISGDCPNPDAATTIQSRLETEGSSADITLTPTPAGSTRIIFNNFGQVVTATAQQPFTMVQVDNTTLSSTDKRPLNLTINVGGNVRMCDPKFSYASDPKGC